MSAAARKAISVRMKRCWAERKKAQAKAISGKQIRNHFGLLVCDWTVPFSDLTLSWDCWRKS